MAAKTQRPSRMTLELPPKARTKLEKISEETDQTLSEVIRRSIALYDLLRSETASGGRIVIRRSDGDREVIVTEFAD